VPIGEEFHFNPSFNAQVLRQRPSGTRVIYGARQLTSKWHWNLLLISLVNMPHLRDFRAMHTLDGIQRAREFFGWCCMNECNGERKWESNNLSLTWKINQTNDEERRRKTQDAERTNGLEEKLWQHKWLMEGFYHFAIFTLAAAERGKWKMINGIARQRSIGGNFFIIRAVLNS
jgi:hypothetical protein